MLDRWKKLLEAILDDKVTGSNSTPPIDDPTLQSLEPDKEKQPEVKEEDVTKLDLTQPEHLQKFKASYAGYKQAYEESGREISQLRQEIDTIRADQGKGVYLDTNVPLEDFNPDEALTRMKAEEPEYYEQLKNSFMSINFWPSMSDQFSSFEGKKLDVENNQQDAQVVDSMLTAWDAMSRRMYSMSGDTVDAIIHSLVKNPDLSEELYRRATGLSFYKSDSPYIIPRAIGRGVTYPSASFNDSYPQQLQVETTEQIATRLHLDPSEEVHLRHIEGIQDEQRQKQQRQMPQSQSPQVDPRQQAHITQLEQTIKDLKAKEQKATTVSDEELAARADERLSQLTSSSLKEDINRLYSNAVPKEKLGLLSTLEIVVEQRLRKDPNYLKAEKTARGWFKQSMGARTPQDRDRRDKQGIDALAVMVPIRAKYLKEEAEKLIGPTKQLTPRRTAPPPTREIPANNNRPVPPRNEAQPAAAGDISSAKKAIQDRARRAGLLT